MVRWFYWPFFRAVDRVSCNKPFHVVAAKWNCSMVDKAIAKCRNEVFHILADVEETEDSATRSIFPRLKVCWISLLPPLSHPCTSQQRESGLLSNGFKVFLSSML